MLARYLEAPLLLLLWQVAPVDLRPDEGGRVRLSFGAGGGAFSFQDYPGSAGGVDCFGDRYGPQAPSTHGSSYSSAGASAEVWARNNIRIRAALGNVNDPTGERHGAYGAVQAVLERPRFGVGLGLASLGGLTRSLQPSASARFGSLDGVSLRADYRGPDSWMGLIGGPRIGLGVRQGRTRKTRFFFGLATTPVPDSARRVGGFAELALPIWFLKGKGGFTVNGFLSGKYHGNEDKQIYGLGLAGWIQP